MNDPVLDSSALLALLLAEPGADQVLAVLPGAWLSAVNLAEVLTKLNERGMPADVAQAAVAALGVEIADYDALQAYLTAELREVTRGAGLSLGDRACLALARLRGVPAYTADRVWTSVQGFEVVLIR